MSEDVVVPFIIDCPFLTTTKAIIDVGKGKLTLRLGDERVIIRLVNAIHHTLDHDDTLPENLDFLT